MKQSIGNYYHPTATVSCSRLPIFAPVKRISPHEIKKRAKSKTTQSITFETPYGTCTTIQKNRLTQMHRDIIEAILTYHKQIHVSPEGDVAYLINPYELIKKMRSTCNMTCFKQHLEDMRATQLIVNESGWTIHSGILLRYKYLEDAKETTRFGKGKTFAVQFSREFMRAFTLELNVHYPRLVEDILAIESPLIRATVRFFLTHTNTNIRTGKLLDTLGIVGVSERSRRLKTRELLKHSDLLEHFGITINSDTLKYRQHELVWFTKPKHIGSIDNIQRARKSHTPETEVTTSEAEVPFPGNGSHNLGTVEHI